MPFFWHLWKAQGNIDPFLEETVEVPLESDGGIQELAFDGHHVWGTIRPYSAGDGAVAKVDPSGNEFLYRWSGPDPSSSLWAGAAGICFDGQYMWVSDGDFVGTPDDIDARTRAIRVIDTSSDPPTLVTNIDVSAFTPFNTIRRLRLSQDGQYVFASLKGSAGGSMGTYPGRCLVIDVASKAVVGNAVLKTGDIGFGYIASGARDAVDTGDGKLWVCNSSLSTLTLIERFDLAEVLSNGTSPTSSVAEVTAVNHAEELTFANGYLWSSGWAYYPGITRINPSNDDIEFDVDLEGRYLTGVTAAFGHLWAGGYDDNLHRLDPSLFGTGNMVTYSLNLPAPHSIYVRNGMVAANGRLWVPVRENGGDPVATRLFKVNPGS